MTFGSPAKVFDPSDDPFFTVVGNGIEGSYFPVGSDPAGSAPGSGPGSVISVTSGGITINLLFDAAAMAAPAGFRAGIQQAATLLSAAIFDPITVNLKIDYSGTGGGAAAGPDNGLFESYTTVRSDLISHATPGDTIFNTLPSGSSIQGQSNVAVWNAQLKLWGILGANDTTTDDGSATFATDINPNLLVGVALHELTHALGRVPYGPQPDIFDLFRFTSSGVRLFQGGATAPAAYFSLDGGVTKLADFGRTSDASDFLNSGLQGSTDPFNEFYNGSTSQFLSVVDKQILDAIGFHTTTAVVTTTVIEAQGSTKLDQVGINFFFDPISGGSGPELKYAGAAMTVGQWGSWTPIGVEATVGGYEVAWKVAGADLYTVWNTDSSGNITTDTIGSVSGSSVALQTLETSFHQDLNGDGTIGILGSGTSAISTLMHAPSDFNKDGPNDILWQRSDGTVAIWDSGQIAGAHWVANPGVVPNSSHIQGTGDFDGNGHADTLWRDDDGSVFVWDNGLPGGAHTLAAAGVIPSGWHIVGTGDFDANTKSDILWERDDGTVSIWDNGQINGAHVISSAGAVPSTSHIVGIGDFDGNHTSDILWRDDNGAVFVWDSGQPNTAHTLAAAGIVPSGWNIVGTGDFDGNGKTDILWQRSDGVVSIWDNGQINSAHVISGAGAVPSTMHIVGVGDFDHNLQADILWRDDNGAVTIWDNGQPAGAHVASAAGVVPSGWHIV
jgi:Tryptophan-rich Synechocystis species C-terminal domain